MVTRSTRKRWTQTQLTKMFIHSAGMGVGQTSELRYQIWMNPTSDDSLRLSVSGFKFVNQTLNLRCYTFEIDPPLTNKQLLQLERYFQGMYFLLNGKKLVLYDESEAASLVLYENDVTRYLQTLEESFTDDF